MNKQHYSEKFDLRNSYDLLQSQRKKSSPTLETASGSDDRYLHTKATASLGNKNNFPEHLNNWEKQFNQRSFAYNQAPAVPFSNEFQMASFDQYSNIYDDLDPQSSQAPAGPVGDIIPQAPQPPDIQWNQIQPAVTQLPSRPNDLEEQLKKEAAIASEVRHQQATLLKQKEEYLRKVAVFKKELDTLKEQRTELKGNSRRSPSPDSRRFLKENGKLQLEIQNKLKTMHNVIDMLNGIIGDKTPSSLSPPKVGKSKKSKKSKHSSNSSSSSPERDVKKSRSRSKSTTREKRFNYVYYDPEMHWCRLCNVFPPTAKDFLNHLHTAQHHRAAAAHMEAPWHSAPNLNEGLPNYPSAPTKRTPIRGLQFFVPSTAWYCKLCDHWIGDLHCASAHLKSIMHSKNYSNFVEQNPHWETDWMSDRQKSFEKVRGGAPDMVSKEKSAPYVAHTITFDKDGFSTKRKSEQSDPDSPSDKKKKDKKKSKKSKRRSSSSSSNSSRSSHRSRRDSKHGKNDKEKLNSSDKNTKQDDRMLAQWMTLEEHQLSDQDKRILDNLKRRVKKRVSESSEKIEEQRRISREREVRELVMLRARDAEKTIKKRDSSHHNNDHNSAAKKQQAEPPRGDKDKKAATDQKKMPFIGKMPVFKSLTKPTGKPDPSQPSKSSDADDKKQDNEMTKRRAELDAEIQKKVAEFKEMMSRKKQENSALRIAAPGLALPTALGGNVGLEKAALGIPAYNFPQTIHRVQKDPVLVSAAPVTFPPHQAPPPKPSNINKNDPLHKDFQEALDIIFPSEAKKEEEMKMDPMNAGMPHMAQMPPPNLAPAYPVMPANFHPPNGPMPMPMPGNGPNMMMGGMFDYNQPQPTFIPAFDMSQHPGNRMNQPLQMQNTKTDSNKKKANAETPPSAAKTKKNEDLDDLAMLGIDVADVGASGF